MGKIDTAATPLHEKGIKKTWNRSMETTKPQDKEKPFIPPPPPTVGKISVKCAKCTLFVKSF